MEPKIVGIWGNDKTGKTSLALTFPKPILYMEFDIGGYKRAKYGYPGMGTPPMKLEADGQIIVRRYIVPLQGYTVEATVRPSKIVTGVKEQWYAFLGDFITEFLGNKDIVTGVIDTGTLLWETVHTAYLQEKQELQLDPQGNIHKGVDLRVSLKPVEYREPNIRMRGLTYHSAAAGKNLVLTHHSRDEFKPVFNPKTGVLEDARTGAKERAGFGSLGDGTDWMIHTFRDKDGFQGTMDEGSVPSGIMGITLKNPTYDSILKQVNQCLGIGGNNDL